MSRKIKIYSSKVKAITKAGNVKAPKLVIPRAPAKGLIYIMNILRSYNIPFVEEHKFHPTRRFKFDIAIVNWKIAIEYEGLVSDISRHTTIAGYTNDTTKYNLAQLEGWKVLRYTTKNYHQFKEDLESVILLNMP